MWGRETHTHRKCVCAEAERIMGLRLVRPDVCTGWGGEWTFAPVEAGESGRHMNGMCDRRKWRMSGTEKSRVPKAQRRRGWDIFVNKEIGRGESGREEV